MEGERGRTLWSQRLQLRGVGSSSRYSQVYILTYHRYEKYERVDMGDFNWVTPQFIAFASPQHKPVAPISPSSPQYATLPSDIAAVEANTELPVPFKNVLTHFSERKVGLVVRLNSELYCPSYFTALGMKHLDMIFDDGTCPPLPLVKKFIKLAHEMITQRKKAIAVHCKAGLGRTGCLIGAYLIYRYGFTANEMIAYMRFMRPGMVVGPQQHWLHLNQGKFREWWWEDVIKEKLALVLPSTPTKSSSHRHRLASNGQTATPPNGSSKRAALGEINTNEATAVSTTMDECLPAPTPGQPRKTSRMNSPIRQYATAQAANHGILEDKEPLENETVEVHSHRKSQGPRENETEEEWQMRMIRRTSSRSPGTSDKRRAISYTTTTTTTTFGTVDDDLAAGIMSDVENWGTDIYVGEKASRPKTPASTKSGSGSGTLGITKIRGSPLRRSAESRGEKSGGVRKTSGRVGSVGAIGVARSKP
jgi:cell division cycle 14